MSQCRPNKPRALGALFLTRTSRKQTASSFIRLDRQEHQRYGHPLYGIVTRADKCTKPIAQKHQIWTKAACCKPSSPSFTTTPLFHGGFSDLLRAMMSKSLLYMYPSTMSITSAKLIAAFDTLQPRPTSFLSVPYILEQLAESDEGVRVLASLELVSTGGSPMPDHIGDKLCRNGVNLVSRYGSSECGCTFTPFSTRMPRSLSLYSLDVVVQDL